MPIGNRLGLVPGRSFFCVRSHRQHSRMDFVRAKTPGSLNGDKPKNYGTGRRCACGTKINQYHKGDKCGLCERDPDRAARVVAEREREQAEMLGRNKWKSKEYPDGCSECPDGEKLVRRHAGSGLCSLHYQRARKEAARLAEAEAAAMRNGDALQEHLDDVPMPPPWTPVDDPADDPGPVGTYRYDEAPHVCEQHPLKAWPHDDCPGPGVPLSEAELRRHESSAEPDLEVEDEGCPDCGETEQVAGESGGDAVYTQLACGNSREYRKGVVTYMGDCERRIKLDADPLGTPSERDGRLEVVDAEPGYPHRAAFDSDEAYEAAVAEFEGETRTILIERSTCCGTRPDGSACTGDCAGDVEPMQCCGQRPEGDMDCSRCPLDEPEDGPSYLERAIEAAERSVELAQEQRRLTDRAVEVAARAVAYKVNLDPEARAIDAIAKALDPLDGEARRRVIDWAWSRFMPPADE